MRFSLLLHAFLDGNFRFNLAFLEKVWERAEDFMPERFDLDGPIPNETNTDFRCLLSLYFNSYTCHSLFSQYLFFIFKTFLCFWFINNMLLDPETPYFMA